RCGFQLHLWRLYPSAAGAGPGGAGLPVDHRTQSDGLTTQSGGVMNKDKIKGKVKDVTGRAKRQAGEWTGDGKLQAEGAMEQAEGKAQNAWGKAKDAARDVKDDMRRPIEHRRQPEEPEREDTEKKDEAA